MVSYLHRINSNPDTDPNPNPNPNSHRLIGRSYLTFTIRSTCQLSTNTASAHQPLLHECSTAFA